MRWVGLLVILLSSFALPASAYAADLVQVYEQAVISDPVYQQALSQRLANQEGVPISLAGLLPAANIQAVPSLSKFRSSGNTQEPEQDTTRAYQVSLNLSQTIFDFGKFANLRGAKALSKQADAVLNDATQQLMLRVANAYFAILQDEDNLVYNEANKAAYAKQLDQIHQQYKVGLKTVTDVYTAQASYDTAAANYIAAQTALTNDNENLRAITGNVYPALAKLSEKFPLISPHPEEVEAWVITAQQQNWSIKAAEYSKAAALQNMKQQFAGHLPTLNAAGGYIVNYSRNSGGTFVYPAGTFRTNESTVSLTLNVPLVQGGLVVAQTDQARYQYQVSTQQLEQAFRATANTTRQSYAGIISGIKQIQADRQAIKSTISSLEGLKAGYHVGTQTLVDVLNQQQKVFQTQTQYASDRYTYVKNLLQLKYAAGTLSQEDLAAINAWLFSGMDERHKLA
jgi:outer membrane protein